MNYLTFHLVFNLPFLLILLFLNRSNQLFTDHFLAAAVVLLIVVVFTSPWDNYAVFRGIWGFPRHKYLFRVGWLPVEEYAFFLIQSVQVMLLVVWLVSLHPQPLAADEAMPWAAPLFWAPAFAVLALWGWLGVNGAKKINRIWQAWHYAWHLLYWFLPVVLIQWLLAWPILAPRAWILALATAIAGTYLSVADWVAVRNGIWFFDPKQITGHKVATLLPWEEVAFFYLTSLLVAQSYLMFLPDYLR